jgi:hypothetical protein
MSLISLSESALISIHRDVVDLDATLGESSSTWRYDNPKRRYQRTSSKFTSGGKPRPEKVDRGTGAGRGPVLMAAVWPLGRAHGRNSAAAIAWPRGCQLGTDRRYMAESELAHRRQPHVATVQSVTFLAAQPKISLYTLMASCNACSMDAVGAWGEIGHMAYLRYS